MRRWVLAKLCIFTSRGTYLLLHATSLYPHYSSPTPQLYACLPSISSKKLSMLARAAQSPPTILRFFGASILYRRYTQRAHLSSRSSSRTCLTVSFVSNCVLGLVHTKVDLLWYLGSSIRSSSFETVLYTSHNHNVDIHGEHHVRLPPPPAKSVAQRIPRRIPKQRPRYLLNSLWNIPFTIVASDRPIA